MADNIKFSVIIPVYNVEKYLKECLDSLINQTFKNIEFIFINDGSTDNSVQIIEEYAQKDARIKLITQQNQGQGIARNNGIKLAKGEYIAFIDPDDWVDLELFQELNTFIEQRHPDVLQFDFYEFYEYSGITKPYNLAKKFKRKFNYDLTKKNYYSWKDCNNRCLTRLSPLCWNKVYSKQFLIDNNIVFAPNKFGEDLLFSHNVLFSAEKIYVLDKYLYYYRHRANSATNKKIENIYWTFENLDFTKNLLVEKGIYEALKKEYNRYKLKKIIKEFDVVPEDKIAEYKDIAKKYLSKFEYFKFLHFVGELFFDKMFYIKHTRIDGMVGLQICVLGYKFFIKRK